MFELLRDTMKYLQWQGLADRDKKWLLKAPTYYGLEPALLDVFPDAHFIMTHRSVLQTVPSSCKLIECFRQPYCNARVDAEKLTTGFATMIDLHFENRRTMPQGRILDVHFEHVSHAIEDVIERIYAHCGMELAEAALHRMRAWSQSNTMHRLGAFRYALEDYGMHVEQVKALFDRYLRFVDALLH